MLSNRKNIIGIVIAVLLVMGSIKFDTYLAGDGDYISLNAIDESYLEQNGYKKRTVLIDDQYYNSKNGVVIQFDGYSVMGYNSNGYKLNEYVVSPMFFIDGNGQVSYRFEVFPLYEDENPGNTYILIVESKDELVKSSVIDSEIIEVMQSFIDEVEVVVDHDYQFEGFYGEDGIEHEQLEYEQTTEYLGLTEYQNNDFMGSVYRNFNEDMIEYTIVLDGRVYEEVTVYNSDEGYDYLTDNANDIIKAKIRKYDQLLIEKEV